MMTTRGTFVSFLLGLSLIAAACSSSTTISPSTTSPPTTFSTSSSTTATSTVPVGSSTTTSIPPTTTIPVPHFVDANGFDDHTLPVVNSELEYFALAREGNSGTSVMKFNIPNMLIEENVNWMDSNFYRLHDQWYSFRLLNGQPVPAIEATPIDGLSFDTVEDMDAWALSRPPGELPRGFRLVESRQTGGTRFYAPDFYAAALDRTPRNYGVGSIIHMPTSANDGGERWLIELEFSDDPTPEEIALFFERLGNRLPDSIGEALEWVIRSPHQDVTAKLMAAESLPYHDRIVRFSELVEPGVVEVYNEGITAGRLLLVDGENTQLTDSLPGDILLVENVPDFLPPAAALISSSPQTPLAHVNILAQNRGIPNASQAGLLDDPGIRQAARVRAHVIVRASGIDGLEIIPITRDDYNTWTDLVDQSPISVGTAELDDYATVLDLTTLSEAATTEEDIAELRPVIGGKSAGFLTLLRAQGVTTPLTPQAITTQPYFEHLALLQPQLDAMLSNADFVSSARARFLLLEGPGDFADVYDDSDDIEFAEQFIAGHPPGTPIGDILEADGFMNLFRDEPMDDVRLSEITASLKATFGDYAETQGLRFRSSSSVEDIEGFNGAGLYDSNTGFLAPERQPDEDDHKKSVERTIKKTWASYWGFEAVEERILERVDHRSGGMAVLVHARFDDPLEDNNGVATFTILPESDDANPDRDRAVALINVQAGDTSVANPDPTTGDLPEMVSVTVNRFGEYEIERLSESTLSTEDVLSDEEVTELVAQLESSTRLWLDRLNAPLPAEVHASTLTLDFEFKTMKAGWPAQREGSMPPRLVVKQARSLEPGLRALPESVRELPIPADVLARARHIEQVDCGASGGTTNRHYEVLTDDLQFPDMGFSTEPGVFGGSSSSTSDECDRRILYASSDEYLLGLIINGSQLDLSSPST